MPKVKKPAPKKGGAKKAAPKKAIKRAIKKAEKAIAEGRVLTERQADQLAADRMRDESYVAANKPQALNDSTATKPLHPTVEEQYAAAKDAYTRTLGDAESQELHRALKALEPPKKPTLWARFRSAVTGLFVSKKYAEANPDTTVRERVK